MMHRDPEEDHRLNQKLGHKQRLDGSWYGEYRKPERKPKPISLSDDERKYATETYLMVNHLNFLKEGLNIGNMGVFDEDPENVVDEVIVTGKCHNYDVRYKVRYGKVMVGGKPLCYGITTDKLDIGSRMFMNGFGSYCHLDEAKTMEEGVIAMATKHNLMICNKICSWPYAKAIVQPIPEEMLVDYTEKALRSKDADK